jgi:hypothetical protein
MVQIPSWEADSLSASQQILKLLWKPKVHYSGHKTRKFLDPMQYFVTNWFNLLAIN